MRIVLLITVFFIAFQPVFAAKQTVAVLPSEGVLNDDELDFFTNKAQEIAVKTLPKSSFEVFPQEVIFKRLGGVDSYVKECKEVSCIVELGRKAQVDYVAQCRFGKFGSDLTVSFELYKVSTSGLIDKFVESAKNINGLRVIMEKKIPDGFMKIPSTAPEAKTTLPPADGEVSGGMFTDSRDSEKYKIPGAAPEAKPTLSPAGGEVSGGMFTDSRDGKKYRAVKIGSQTWMAENLNYDASGSECYDNKPENCQKYGRLYDWATAMKVCPLGWHLPSKDEYETLDKAVGGKKVAGEKLKAKSGWNRVIIFFSGNGTDKFRFSALPGGYGNSDSSFGNVGYHGHWWSASEGEYISDYAYGRYMYYNYDYTYWGYNSKSFLFSVRCVLD